jgi:hypothetical protein
MTAPHPDAERLTLAALPAEQPDPEVAAHLRRCAQCRAEVNELRRTVELSRVDGVGDPLPIPPTRVWQAILDELAGDDVGTGGSREHPATADAPGRLTEGGPTVLADRRQRRAPWWRRSAVGVAAAAVVGLGLGAGIGFGLGGSDDEPAPTPLVQLGPVGFADPGASGTAAMVDRNGDTRMVVELRGVTNLAGGDYLEAWLMDGTGTRLVPLGALARHGEEFRGEFTIPAGLPAGEYNRVDVSAEQFDGNPGHSAVSLLRGDLA